MDETYRVVIADDEIISRGYIELFIKPSKRYEIVEAFPFAQDVIDWCGKNPLPDLIILDVMMASGIDGLTAAEQIKQTYPGVRIIAATSMADTDWLEKARQIGRMYSPLKIAFADREKVESWKNRIRSGTNKKVTA